MGDVEVRIGRKGVWIVFAHTMMEPCRASRMSRASRSPTPVRTSHLRDKRGIGEVIVAYWWSCPY